MGGGGGGAGVSIAHMNTMSTKHKLHAYVRTKVRRFVCMHENEWNCPRFHAVKSASPMYFWEIFVIIKAYV